MSSAVLESVPPGGVLSPCVMAMEGEGEGGRNGGVGLYAVETTVPGVYLYCLCSDDMLCKK